MCIMHFKLNDNDMRYLYDVISMKGEYVSTKFNPGLCEKPRITNLVIIS
jgi:hypothetical protein